MLTLSQSPAFALPLHTAIVEVNGEGISHLAVRQQYRVYDLALRDLVRHASRTGKDIDPDLRLPNPNVVRNPFPVSTFTDPRP